MKKVIAALILIILAAAGWYFVSPLFITNEVNEEFPVAKDAATTLTPQEVLERDKEFAATAPDVVVEDSMPEQPTRTGPVALASGQFEDADSFHQGSGTATLYQATAAEQLVRLEDFEVTNGPDLVVLLSRHPAPRTRADLGEDYLDLGSLKGNIGNQNYTVPAGVDTTGFKSVVIYCKPFHVVFSTATLQ